MAFHAQFVKLVMGGLRARLRRCRPDAPRSASAARRKREDFEPRTRRKNSKQEMNMGLLRFAKSVGTKIFGATGTAAAPPEQLKQEAAKHGLDVSKVEVKTEGDKVILSGSAASTEEAEKIMLAIGNSVGVATVQNDLAAGAKVPGSKFYTVKPGDSLWKIAEAEYGHGHGGEYHRIFAANKPLLSDPGKIYPGQVLRIPPLLD
jgi:nucleoid-associated protein YgaU